MIRVYQDATGGRSLTFNASYVFNNGTPQINKAPSAETIFAFIYNGTDLRYAFPAEPSTRLIYKNSAPVSLTGTTTATILVSVSIPAFTFQENDEIYISLAFSKAVTTATVAGDVYISPLSNSITGGTLVQQITSMTASDRYLKTVRSFKNRNSLSSMYVFATSSGIASDVLLSSQAPSTITGVNWGLQQYILVRLTPGNSADSVTMESIAVEILR
jgi:hypothetical protein